MANTVCIISDTNHHTYAKDGAKLESRVLFAPDESQPTSAEWGWDLAPRGELSAGRTINADVCAWLIES